MIPVWLTNRLRTAMDEWLPRSVRDSRVFMYPFFLVWFKGRNVRLAMDFKREAPRMTAAEFRDACRRVVSLGENRESDTNPEALRHVLDLLPREGSLMDVGCGRGHFLRALQSDGRFDALSLTGCDVLEQSATGRARYVCGDLESLPFASRTFDVVTCFHTLEHVRDVGAAVRELRRVARRQLIVAVPRQRAFHHTLDLHLNFFETADALRRALGVDVPVQQFGSDLVAVVSVEPAVVY